MPSAALRRALAATSALALGAAGALAAVPAFAAPTSAPSPITPAVGAVIGDSTPELRWGHASSDHASTLRYRTEVTNSNGNWVAGMLAVFDDDWTVPYNLPDGTYSWRVRGVDTPSWSDIISLGPWSTAQSFTIDTTAPDLTLAEPATGTFGGGGIAVAGTVTDLNPSRVELFDNGTLVATDSSGGSTFSFVHAPASGAHTLTVVATDAAGNSDAGSSASIALTVDADAPSVAIITPSAGSFVKLGDPIVFRATASDANSFSWNGRLDNNGIPGAYQHLVAGPVDYTTTVSTAGWVDGSTHTFLFTARDRFDQASSVQAKVTADGSKPKVTFQSPAVSAQLAGVVSISGTAIDTGSGVSSFKLEVRELNQNGNCGSFLGSGSTVPVASDGSWSLLLDTAEYGDGRFCLTALASDGVGNTNGGGDHLKSVTFDNTAPSGTLSGVFPQGFTLEADHLEWTALTDPHGVTYELALGNHPNVDADGLMTSGLQLLGTTTETSHPYDFPTGPGFWQVRATDNLGNSTPWTAPIGFQVIGVPEIVYPTPGLEFSASTLTAQWTPSFGVNGVARYELRYGLDRDHDGVLEYETRTVEGHSTWPEGIQSRVQSFTSGYEGPLTVEVRAIYNLPIGGSTVGPWSAPAVSYFRDTAKPTVAIVAPELGSVVKASEGVPVTVTGTDAAGISRLAANLYAADGTTFLRALGSTAPGGALGTSATSTWTLPSGLAEGAYVIKASATDAAGKTTATTRSFTVDSTRPTVTIDVPSNGAVLNQDVTVTVTGLDPHGIRSIAANLYDAANTNPALRSIGQSTAPAGATTHSATWTIPLSWFAADGTYTVRAGGFDAAGNNRTVTATFTIDRTGPVAPQPNGPQNGLTQAGDERSLSWAPVTDAVSYEVLTSSSPGRTPNANDGELNGSDLTRYSTSSTTQTVTGLPEGWLWWQVRGVDALGNTGPWSNIWATGVDTVAPLVALTSPADSAVLTTGSFDLEWTAPESDLEYEVRSSIDGTVDPATGELVGTLGGGVATVTTNSLALAGVPEQTYYWQVRAIDTHGNVGPWTTPWSVTVDLPTLSVPGGTEGTPTGGTPGGTPAGTAPAEEDVDLTTFAIEDDADADEDDAAGGPEARDAADAAPASASAGVDAGLIALLVGIAAALLLFLVVFLAWLRRRSAEA